MCVEPQLGVDIGILRAPKIDTERYLESTVGTVPMVRLLGPEALVSAKQTNMAVRLAKGIVAEAVTGLKLRRLDHSRASPKPSIRIAAIRAESAYY